MPSAPDDGAFLAREDAVKWAKKSMSELLDTLKTVPDAPKNPTYPSLSQRAGTTEEF
jgi:hypothetical protein